eukprot:2769233-Pyramimonas_sp.AAC.1
MGKTKGSATWSGVVFPKDDKGERTTTKLGKKVWAAAAAAIEDNQAAVDAINNEKDWRHKYGNHVGTVISHAPRVTLHLRGESLDTRTAAKRHSDICKLLKSYFNNFALAQMDLAKKQMWSTEAAVNSAKAGLECIHSEFDFIRGVGGLCQLISGGPSETLLTHGNR